MKKILIVFLVCTLYFSAIPAFSADDIEPKWDNLISPEEYAHDDLYYIENDTVCYKKPWLCALGALTFVGIPGVIVSSNRSSRIERNNYWFKRKQEFELQRNMCNLIKNKDQKIQCYIQLRQAEHNKTLKEEELRLRQAELTALQNQSSSNYSNAHYNHGSRHRYNGYYHSGQHNGGRHAGHRSRGCSSHHSTHSHR